MVPISILPMAKAAAAVDVLLLNTFATRNGKVNSTVRAYRNKSLKRCYSKLKIIAMDFE